MHSSLALSVMSHVTAVPFLLIIVVDFISLFLFFKVWPRNSWTNSEARLTNHFDKNRVGPPEARRIQVMSRQFGLFTRQGQAHQGGIDFQLPAHHGHRRSQQQRLRSIRCLPRFRSTRESTDLDTAEQVFILFHTTRHFPFFFPVHVNWLERLLRFSFPSQVIDSFRILAGDNPYILPDELRRELPRPGRLLHPAHAALQPYQGQNGIPDQ
jgi:hypothetical protein